jgi:hypothetical protein
MDPRRLRAGDWVASASGAALFVSLFLPWYSTAGEDATAWQSLAAVDVALALVALLAASLVPVTASLRVPAVPVALSAFVTLAGLIALVPALVRVANLPGAADGREWGLWLGVLAAIGIVVGSGFAMRDERLSPPGRHTDLTGRPGPPPPVIEPLAAPRPE